MKSTQKEIINTFYDEVWNKNNINLVSEILDKELTFRGSIGEIKQGHSGFIGFWVTYLT